MIEKIIAKDKAFFVAHTEMPIVAKAGALSRSTTFHHYLGEYLDTEIQGEDEAAAIIRAACEITTRAQLQVDIEARQKFQKLFNSYLEWLEQHIHK